MDYKVFIKKLNYGYEFKGYVNNQEFTMIHQGMDILLSYNGNTIRWDEETIIFCGATLREIFDRNLIILEELF